jgi:hypothetical protein
MRGWMINWKGCGWKWSWAHQGTHLAIAWKNWGKPQKTPVRIATVLTEIRT